jgi:hypothetical protein
MMSVLLLKCATQGCSIKVLQLVPLCKKLRRCDACKHPPGCCLPLAANSLQLLKTAHAPRHCRYALRGPRRVYGHRNAD